MAMTLKEAVLEIQANLRAGSYPNEASVSLGIVLRLCDLLGWNIHDSKTVCSEYGVEGRRVDFALCHPRSRPIAFVEVKAVGGTNGADRQLFEYAFHVGVPFAVLTDGRQWHFYLPGEQGSYQERRLYKLDFLERSADEVVEVLTKYLSHSRFVSGEALDDARNDYRNIAKKREANTELPNAWRSLLADPDPQLVELLAIRTASACGHRPDKDTVETFLRNQPILSPAITVTPVQKETRRRLEPVSPSERMLAELSSPVAAFVREQCRLGPEYAITVDCLFDAWRGWCKQNGRGKAGTKQRFGRELAAVVPGLVIRRNHALGRRYEGLCLNDNLGMAISAATVPSAMLRCLPAKHDVR
jgi:predicted type IV restriction endonuclease